MSGEQLDLDELVDFVGDSSEISSDRLFEFIRNKKGQQRKPHVFMDYEPTRLSLDVQVERIPPQETEKEKENTAKEQTALARPFAQTRQERNEATEDAKTVQEPGVKAPPKSQNVEPLIALSPTRPLRELPQVPMTPTRSPRKSATKVPTSDRLRRYSLKKSLRRSSSARRLYNTSSSDSSPFEPPGTSTPISDRDLPKAKSFGKSKSLSDMDLSITIVNQSAAKASRDAVVDEQNLETEGLEELIKEAECETAREVTLRPANGTVWQEKSLEMSPPVPSIDKFYDIDHNNQTGNAMAVESPQSQTLARSSNRDQALGFTSPVNASVRSHLPVSRLPIPTTKNTTRAYIASPKMLKALSKFRQRNPVASPHTTPVKAPGVDGQQCDIPRTPLRAEQNPHNANIVDSFVVPETQEFAVCTNEIIRNLSHKQSPMVVIPIHQVVNQNERHHSDERTFAKNEAQNNATYDVPQNQTQPDNISTTTQAIKTEPKIISENVVDLTESQIINENVVDLNEGQQQRNSNERTFAKNDAQNNATYDVPQNKTQPDDLPIITPAIKTQAQIIVDDFVDLLTEDEDELPQEAQRYPTVAHVQRSPCTPSLFGTPSRRTSHFSPRTLQSPPGQADMAFSPQRTPSRVSAALSPINFTIPNPYPEKISAATSPNPMPSTASAGTSPQRPRSSVNDVHQSPTAKVASPQSPRSPLTRRNQASLAVSKLQDNEKEDLQESQQESSNVPLNLVTSTIKNRKSHLMGCSVSSRRGRRLYPIAPSSDSDEPLNLKQSNKRTRRSRLKRPSQMPYLNKAPNTPINGELFAKEFKALLAGMSNNQILDLRKRNSLGRVFPLNGGKSLTRKQAEQNRKQLELEIETEIIKRNLQGNSEGLESEEEEGQKNCHLPREYQDDEIFLELSVPSQFKDNATKEVASEHIKEGEKEETAAVEQPQTERETFADVIDDVDDRVSFVPNNSKLKSRSRGRRQRVKQRSQELQNYVNATQKVWQQQEKHKQVANLTTSKRSLYTRGNSIIENSDNNEAETTDLASNVFMSESSNARKTKSQDDDIPIVPSPPLISGTEDEDIAVVPPPPKMSLARRPSYSSVLRGRQTKTTDGAKTQKDQGETQSSNREDVNQFSTDESLRNSPPRRVRQTSRRLFAAFSPPLSLHMQRSSDELSDDNEPLPPPHDFLDGEVDEEIVPGLANKQPKPKKSATKYVPRSPLSSPAEVRASEKKAPQTSKQAKQSCQSKTNALAIPPPQEFTDGDEIAGVSAHESHSIKATKRNDKNLPTAPASSSSAEDSGRDEVEPSEPSGPVDKNINKNVSKTSQQLETPPLEAPSEVQDDEVPGPSRPPPASQHPTVNEDDGVFKKPLPPPALKKGKQRGRPRKQPNPPERLIPNEDHSDLADSSALRRSRRGQVPLINKLPLLQQSIRKMLEKENEARQKRMQETKRHRTSKSTLKRTGQDLNMTTMLNMQPIASSTAATYSAAKTTEKKPKRAREGKKKQLPETQQPVPVHSLLGDTNATNTVASSIGSNMYTPAAAGMASEQPSTSKRAQKNKTNNKKQNIQESKELEPLLEEPSGMANEQPTSSKNTQKKKNNKKQHNQDSDEDGAPRKKRREGLQHSRLVLPLEAPVNKLNDIFDQLKNANEEGEDGISDNQSEGRDLAASSTPGQCRNLRIWVKRFAKEGASPTKDQEESSRNAVSDSTDHQRQQQQETRESPNNGSELLSWLKGLTQADNYGSSSPSSTHEMFEEMHYSAAGKLIFTDLDGIEYAFYDTEAKATLGYLRFKPRQRKSAKRAKRFHLHFIVLSGMFKISTNRDEGLFSTGDMVAIKVGSRYSIENDSDDVAILMVIKKVP